MQYALVNGQKSEATPETRRGHCPACGKEMIAKCGDNYVHHWAHRSRIDCDPWSEPEGVWHRSWKNVVRREFCEVVLPPHRADLIGSAGKQAIVIELQHSTIGTKTIAEREAFYNNLIWVLDVEPFRHNLEFIGPDPKRTGLGAKRFLQFYWHHERPSHSWFRRPVFWDLGNGLMLQVLQLPSNNRGIGLSHVSRRFDFLRSFLWEHLEPGVDLWNFIDADQNSETAKLLASGVFDLAKPSMLSHYVLSHPDRPGLSQALDIIESTCAEPPIDLQAVPPSSSYAPRPLPKSLPVQDDWEKRKWRPWVKLPPQPKLSLEEMQELLRRIEIQQREAERLETAQRAELAEAERAARVKQAAAAFTPTVALQRPRRLYAGSLLHIGGCWEHAARTGTRMLRVQFYVRESPQEWLVNSDFTQDFPVEGPGLPIFLRLAAACGLKGDINAFAVQGKELIADLADKEFRGVVYRRIDNPRRVMPTPPLVALPPQPTLPPAVPIRSDIVPPPQPKFATPPPQPTWLPSAPVSPPQLRIAPPPQPAPVYVKKG